MGNVGTQSAAVATIAAMITPALLILGSASLVASALMRMARVVDRTRNLAAIAHAGTLETLGVTTGRLHGAYPLAPGSSLSGRSLLAIS